MKKNKSKRKSAPKPIDANVAATRLALRWLAEGGFHEGDQAGEIELNGSHPATDDEGGIMVSFSIRVDDLGVEQEQERELAERASVPDIFEDKS